jgi:hypothetical protein
MRMNLAGLLILATASGGCFTSAGGERAVAAEAPVIAIVSEAALNPPEVREAVRVAENYIAARSRWDSEAASDLFHPDAVIVDTPVASRAEQADLFRFFEAADWRWLAVDCDESRLDGSAADRAGLRDPSEPVELVCGYRSENAWSRAIGSGPIAGQFRVAVQDGLIIEMYHDYDVVTWEAEVIASFRAWVENTAPETVDDIWATENFVRPDDADLSLSGRVVPVLGEDAIDAFAELTARFVEAASS